MHTHITYGLAVMLAFGAATGFVGFRFGGSLERWKAGRRSRERGAMIASAQLYESGYGDTAA